MLAFLRLFLYSTPLLGCLKYFIEIKFSDLFLNVHDKYMSVYTLDAHLKNVLTDIV